MDSDRIQNEGKPPLYLDAAVVALLAAVVFSAGLARVGLFEPDEARYAAVAKEMAEGGSLLVPHIAGVPYPAKTPLVFWLTALSIKLFGAGEIAVRAVSILFSVLAVLAVYIYMFMLKGRSHARISAAVLVTCPFFWGLARTGLTDMPFAAFLTGAFLAAHVAMDAEKPGRWKVIMYACLGLAVMSKTLGAMPLLFGAVILESLFRRSGKPLKVFLSPLGVPLFFAIMLPWFIALGIHNSDYLRHILFERSLGAFYTDIWVRPGEWWLYIAVIAGGMLPWTAFLIHAVVRTRPWRKITRERSPDAFAFSCAAAVIVFFSVASTKVVTYILPVFPLLAILCAVSIIRLRIEQFRKLAHLAFAFPAISGIAFMVFAFTRSEIELHGTAVDVLGNLRVVAVIWTVFAVFAWIIACRGARELGVRCLIAAAGTMIVGVLSALPQIDGAVTSRPHSRIISRLALKNFRIVDSGSETLGPAFYTNLPVHFMGKKVNLAFGKKYADQSIFDPDLAVWHREGVNFFLIIRPEAGRRKSKELGIPLYEIARPGRLAVMTNERELAKRD
ncbi:MAG: ArnT family glycosyltransferase [Planctomycetota bacterium]|jgi:4-amino-4-deoxy-L-arabinose transferase-like glycosyltransferase